MRRCHGPNEVAHKIVVKFKRELVFAVSAFQLPTTQLKRLTGTRYLVGSADIACRVKTRRLVTLSIPDVGYVYWYGVKGALFVFKGVMSLRLPELHTLCTTLYEEMRGQLSWP